MPSKSIFDAVNIARRWRYLKAIFTDKAYRVPLFRKLTYLALIVYILIPIDFIPGIFPLVGLVDDIGALALIMGLLVYETERYKNFLETGEMDADDTDPSDASDRVREKMKDFEGTRR
ncbi:MAG: DUF1232 domain-containing protein [Deltaproteobacteria bacterium]|nr:DUF1232 domain-containing protein [Candidatus Zymogenaceae bacterium]